MEEGGGGLRLRPVELSRLSFFGGGGPLAAEEGSTFSATVDTISAVTLLSSEAALTTS